MIEASRHEEQQETRAPSTKVLLANGHRLFRSGLREMLSSADEDIEVLGEAQDDEGAVKLVKEMEPDVVVLDLIEPSAEEQNVIDRMLEASPKTRVVLVSMERNPSSRLAWKLLAREASAQLDANASPEDLVASVRAAARGSRSRGKAFLTVPWASLRRAEHEDGKRELSERELEVLLLAARGLSNRQIAYHLQLSEATVKRHLANLYPKMGVHSRSEATRKAFTEGWFTVQDLALDA